MALIEDAASVLDQFIQDVANLPAEIAHLLEEIEAKDRVIQECRNTIHSRDSSIQKFLKQNGARQANPKEDAYAKTIIANFDKAKVIQEEKVGLSEKAGVLLDRQIRRLDRQLLTLQNEGIIPPDPLLPSLLHPTPGNRVPPVSVTTTGSSTPLNPISHNTPTSATHPAPSTTIANSAISRLIQPQAQTARRPSPANLPATTAPSPAPHPHIPPRSSSSDAHKRRRLLNLPSAGSSLRQTSLGPGTPKAGTPTVRAGSAGPRTVLKKPLKTGTVPGRVGQLQPNGSRKAGSIRRKGGRRGVKAQSDTGEDSVGSEMEASDVENANSVRGNGDGSAEAVDAEGDVEMGEEGEGEDERKYCTCRSVSYGNMVACDNEECPYEWFHWSCVGMTKEPAGKWFCGECRVRLGL